MADIVERTDGILLFVEEMTKAVLEAGSEGEARQTAAVPGSCQRFPSRRTARRRCGCVTADRPHADLEVDPLDAPGRPTKRWKWKGS